ncbi:MAG: lactonase family protein, partial [Bryobacteraceae bacterium]
MAVKRTVNTLLGCALFLAMCAAAAPGGGHYYMYAGTYTGPASKGIYAFRYDIKGVSFQPLGVAAEMPQPSFLAVHPNGRFLYAVSELGNDGTTDGLVYSFAIDPETGKLTFLNKTSSGGGGACH